MNLQVLVTSMHETDLGLFNKMNIQSDVLIANQADSYGYIKEEINGKTAEMITTATRGLSRNRNIAIACSGKDAEYIMFSDDDIKLVDGYEKMVLDEFESHSEAEAIRFNLGVANGVTIGMKKAKVFKKAGILDVTASGVCGLAIKRSVLLKNNLHFNESFGSGTENYCGEDTIFLQDIIKRKVKIYLSPLVIAVVDDSPSTWYEGRTEKYFTVAGKVLAEIFPKTSYLLAVRSAYRFSKRKDTDMKFRKILKCYHKGIKEHLN